MITFISKNTTHQPEILYEKAEVFATYKKFADDTLSISGKKNAP